MSGKVVVLLSTYNGEKYIDEQIESILQQSYSDVKIYIRDDGSKDNTKSVLKKYERKSNIVINYGENIGFFASFLWLLNNCEEADYYAFSDQDDYWFPEKIEVAVDAIKCYTDIPVVYCCNMNFADAEMKNLIKQNRKYPYSIERTVVNGECGYGFTQVMNSKTRELMLGKKAPTYVKSIGHDAWVHMLCLSCGRVIYDEQVHANMRRHGNNTSMQEYYGGTKWKHQLWRINQFLIHGYGKRIYREIWYFYKNFKDVLDENTCDTIELYIRPNNRMKKVLYRERYRDSIIDEIFLRILFLIGRM